jgi:hypothetical protein
MLNLPGHHSTAAIVAEMEDTSGWPTGKARDGSELSGYNIEPNTTFSITDCDNKVNIEIGFNSENGVENNLHKIDTMIEILQDLRKGVELEGKRFARRKKLVPEGRTYGQW